MSYQITPRTDPKGYYSVGFYAGCIGAAAMTLVMWVCQDLGVTRLSLQFEIGSLINPQAVPGVWCMGFMAHVLLGGLFGVLYAGILDAWFRPGAATGALVGVAHAVVMGLVLAFLIPVIHQPVESRPLANHPGFLGLNFGVVTVVLFVIVHMVYGAIVGGGLSAAERGALNLSPPPPVDVSGLRL